MDDLPEDRAAPIRFGRRFDFAIAIFVVVTALVFIFALRNLPARATFFPWFITVSVLIVGGSYAISKWRNPGAWDAQYDPAADTGLGPGDKDTGPAYWAVHGRAVLKVLAIFLALILGVMALGPEFAVPIFLALMLLYGGESPVIAIPSAIAFWAAIHFVFGDMMQINLPTGYVTHALF